MHEVQPEQGERTEAIPRPGEAQSPEGQDHERPAICVLSLADYEAGTVHAGWIDADQPESDIDDAIRQLLRRSPIGRRNGIRVVDWAIAGHRGFGDVDLRPHDDIAWVSAVAHGIVQYGSPFAVWAPHQESVDALARFDVAFLGEHASLAAFGRQFIEHSGMDAEVREALPERLRSYVVVDARRLAHDLVHTGAVWVHRATDGGVWVYRSSEVSDRPDGDVVE